MIDKAVIYSGNLNLLQYGSYLYLSRLSSENLGLLIRKYIFMELWAS